MIDNTQTKELVELFEEVYEVSSQSKDIIKGARTRVKEAKVSLADYAEKLEVNDDVVSRLYKEYEAYRDGKSSWDNDEEDEFTSLLISIQDEVKKEKG